jgi:hypothetical protein
MVGQILILINDDAMMRLWREENRRAQRSVKQDFKSENKNENKN